MKATYFFHEVDTFAMFKVATNLHFFYINTKRLQKFNFEMCFVPKYKASTLNYKNKF